MIKQLSEFVEKVSYVADQIGEFTKQHAAEIHRVTDLLTYNPMSTHLFDGSFPHAFLGVHLRLHVSATPANSSVALRNGLLVLLLLQK